MGDIADFEIEQGIDMLADHQSGHRHFHPEDCSFCQTEDEQEEDR